jgi:hypothetical protein
VRLFGTFFSDVAMIEFYIRPSEDDWFDLKNVDLTAMLRPRSFESHPVSGWGDHRIKTEGAEISFSYEPPGFQVVFEDELPDALATQIAEEIGENIENATKQKCDVINMEGDKPVRIL